MKHILLFGAGKSATCLIDFLLKEIAMNDWTLTVCDNNLSLAQSKIGDAQNAKAEAILVEDDDKRNALIQSADIVLSLLPAHLHFLVAKDCVAFKKNLLTASYVDENIKSLSKEVENKDLVFLCEMGLDPGIDHMSAMKMIHNIKSNNGKITSFLSHCGGLVAPESDDNPWHYKVTWNPRNVVMAGKSGATYKKSGDIHEVPYFKIFKDNPVINIPGLSPLAWYPNRDSLHYISLYELDDISTFIRTTLRYPSFCRGWQKFVTADCTSEKDFEQIKHCTTFKEWFNAKVSPYVSDDVSWTNYLQIYITDPYKNEFSKQLNFFGYNNETPLPSGFSCSADILQHALETNLVMKPEDKDMIVMMHEIEYEKTNVDGELRKELLTSSLVIKGEDSLRTAMAKTVGLPIGMAAKLILQNKIGVKGLHIPIIPEIYEPVLTSLEEHGIIFTETSKAL